MHLHKGWKPSIWCEVLVSEEDITQAQKGSVGCQRLDEVMSTLVERAAAVGDRLHKEELVNK